MEIIASDHINELLNPKIPEILEAELKNPIWLSVSTAASLSGVQDKTIRRAIKSGEIRFKINNDRYSIDLRSLIKFCHTRTKLKNKFFETGLGQYVEKFK